LTYVIVATHCPAFLDDAQARHTRVVRDPGAGDARADDLSPVQIDQLRALGFTKSDILARYKTILLVEGLHDQLVIKGLLGEQLAARRVLVLPLRGITAAPMTAESQILLEFTDATLVVVSDDLNASALDEAHRQCLEARQAGRSDQYVAELLVRLLGKNKTENDAMRKLLHHAFVNDALDRISIFGLSRQDILGYIPCGYLIDGGDTQHDYYAEWEGTQASASFKPWLERKGARFEKHLIQKAVESMRVRPRELDELGRRL